MCVPMKRHWRQAYLRRRNVDQLTTLAVSDTRWPLLTDGQGATSDMLSLEIVQSFTLVLIKRARLCTAEQLFVPNDSRACSIVTTFSAARVPHVLVLARGLLEW
jgi:hypothetical protein